MRTCFSPLAINAAVLVLFLLPPLSALAQKQPRDGIYQIFHPTEKYLILEQYYKEGQRHGPSLRFHKDGLYLEENYKDGKLDGVSRHYHQGKLVSEKFFKDGKPDGTLFIRYAEYKTDGQYVNGKPEGVWTAERIGHWRLVKHYKDGRPDGLWERKSADGKSVLRLTFEKGKLVDQGDELKAMPFLQKVAALAKDEKDKLAQLALAFLEIDTDLEYPETPVSEVLKDLKDRYLIPMYVDNQAADALGKADKPININEKHVQVFAGLHDIAAQHELVIDYRFHSFWLTTPKALAAWKDTTGVSDLKPAEGSSLAKALPEPAKFDLLAAPISKLAEMMRKEHGIEIDASRISTISWHTHDPKPNLPGRTWPPLRDGLFTTLYQNNCRCREAGGKLIIEPL